MLDMRNTVSCIIRTYNEARHIGRLIHVLRSQQDVGEHLEIVVVDSGSTDTTVKDVKHRGVNLIEIPKAKFNYSRALNLGIENSMGEFLFILSGHSIPCGNGWLLKMLHNFKDQRVAGVFCRQVPWPDADAHEVVRIEQAFGENSKTFDRNITNETVWFSNAASCIKRAVWQEHPFVIMPACEDREWATWALANGYKIVYDGEAAVCHSHNESCRKAAQRAIELEKAADITSLRRRDFFLTTRQAAGWFVRDAATVYSSKHFKGRRVRHFGKCLLRSFWYVVDSVQKD